MFPFVLFIGVVCFLSKAQLEKIQKYVQTTEIKIEDLEQELAGCTDRKEKKSLAAAYYLCLLIYA